MRDYVATVHGDSGPPVVLLAGGAASSHGDLLATLQAYFVAVGDVKVAAEALGLHYNTVRYRLRRAADVAGLDLNDPDQRLLAEPQVRLLGD